MTGAIEFFTEGKGNVRRLFNMPDGCITDISILNDEADLVRKVMAYPIKEVSDD